MILQIVLGLAAGYVIGAAPLPAGLSARISRTTQPDLLVGAIDAIRGVLAVALGALLAGADATLEARVNLAALTLAAAVVGRVWPFYKASVAGNGAAVLVAGYAVLFPPGALFAGLFGLGTLGISRRWSPTVAVTVISIPIVYLLLHARVGALVLVHPAVIAALGGAALVVVLKLWPRILAALRGQERRLF